MSLKLLLTISAALFLCISLLPATVNGQAAYNKLLGRRFRFESNNRVGYIRHVSRDSSNSILWLRGRTGNYARGGRGRYELDISFDVVPGLANFGVSFRSVNYPDYYIRVSRKSNGRYQCYLHKFCNKADYRKDATWIPRQGLASGSSKVSFESVTYPGRYMRHSGSGNHIRIRIDRNDGSSRFHSDATWIPRLIKNVAVSGEWSLVYGNDNAVANGKLYIAIDEGVTVGRSSSTSETVENSWKTSVEAEASNKFLGFGTELKGMFETSGSRSVTKTSSSSWLKETRIKKALTFKLVKNAPFYYWQYHVHALTADSSYITSKTDIYKETRTMRAPPLP